MKSYSLKHKLPTVEEVRAEQLRRRRDEALRYYQRPKEHQLQMAFHASQKQRRFFFGGNRTGKTTAGAAEDALYALGRSAEPYVEAWPDRLKQLWHSKYAGIEANAGWVVSTSFETQREVIQPALLNWIPKREIRDVKNRAKDLIDYLVLNNGHRVVFKSAEQGRVAFQGSSLRWAHIDEEIPLDIIAEIEMRLLDQKGHLWGTMTPLIGDIWQEVVEDGRWGEEVCQYWVASWADNPYLDEDEKRKIFANMKEDDRVARVFGRFEVRSGLVYRQFNERIHVIDPFDIPAGWLKLAGFDHGLAAPTAVVWIAFDQDGNGYIYDEHYASEEVPSWHANEIKKRGITRLWADPSTHNRTGPKGERVAGEYQRHGITLVAGNNDWAAGTERLKQYLHYEQDLGTGEMVLPPRLYIMRGRAPNLVREFKKLRWKVGASGQTYEDTVGDDHAIDATKYALMSRPKLRARERKPVRRPTPENPYTGY